MHYCYWSKIGSEQILTAFELFAVDRFSIPTSSVITETKSPDSLKPTFRRSSPLRSTTARRLPMSRNKKFLKETVCFSFQRGDSSRLLLMISKDNF